jgi:carboxypeptidase PM20D1
MPDILNIVIIFMVIVLFLVAFLMVKTMTFGQPFNPVDQVEGVPVDTGAVSQHLSTFINLRTISTGVPDNVSNVAFNLFHQTLETTYPQMHSILKREAINQYSLLYTWKGTQLDLPPVLFAAHQDVVPADPATLDNWEHPPFSGEIENGYIWGRGSLDMKNHLVSLCEAVETLIKQGFMPQRTIFFAFGHDEETGGIEGAAKIAAHLRDHQVELDAVLDEGGLISQGILPGVDMPIALVGVGEKGYLTLELVAEGQPGHSSSPPHHTAIGVLGRALAHLEDHPLPARDWMVRRMFRSIGAAAPFPLQTAFANPWLFGRWIRKTMAKKPSTNAAIRSTTAVTMISGGIKENILPKQARAAVNFRLIPGDTIATVCEHVRKTIKNPQVEIHAVENAAWEPSPVSPDDSPAYVTLETTIRQIFGNIPVAPYIVLGATDGRHYADICQNIYRFSPILANPEDLGRMHGNNERIGVDALGTMVKFFCELIRSWSGPA